MATPQPQKEVKLAETKVSGEHVDTDLPPYDTPPASDDISESLVSESLVSEPQVPAATILSSLDLKNWQDEIPSTLVSSSAENPHIYALLYGTSELTTTAAKSALDDIFEGNEALKESDLLQEISVEQVKDLQIAIQCSGLVVPLEAQVSFFGFAMVDIATLQLDLVTMEEKIKGWLTKATAGLNAIE